MKKIIRFLIIMILTMITVIAITIGFILSGLSLNLTNFFLNRWFREPEPVYVGDYPELFSVAISSVLGMGSDIAWQHPNIIILEEDNYGRILFEYDEGHLYRSRLIMQKVEDGYAYFYPHYNFILSSRPNIVILGTYIPDFQDEEILAQWLELQEEFRERRDSLVEFSEVSESMHLLLAEIVEFPDEEMERLRQENSWNQEMSDTSEFVRVRIVHEKETGPVLPEILVEVDYEFFSEMSFRTSVNDISYHVVFLRTDYYGRSIYFAHGVYTQFVILFQPDHTFDSETSILEITGRSSYQTELRLFMEANGWDTPFISE